MPSAPGRSWLVGFIGFLLLGSAWLIGNPLYASPDEPEHVTRAASVAQGQLVGTRTTVAGVPQVVVRAPLGVVSPRARALCFAHRKRVTAACQRLQPSSGRVVTVRSDAGLYYVPYYLVTGWPTLAAPSPTGVYLMRALSLVACAALIGLAWASVAATDAPLATLGLLFAVTPMVVFLSSAVNPNAVEIAGGVTFWAAGLALVRRVEDDVEGDAVEVSRLVRRIAVGGAAMLLMRPTSPLWLLLIVLALAILASRRGIQTLLARRDVRLVIGLFVVLALANIAWTLAVGSLQPSGHHTPLSFGTALQGSAHRLWHRTLQYFGVFGWLDTRSPMATYVIWWVVWGAAILWCFLRAPARWRASLLATIAVTVLLPVVIEARIAGDYGYIWQGRYTLPFAVGIPLVATYAASANVGHHVQARLLSVGAVGWVIGQLGAYAYNEIRYQHGVHHGVDLLNGKWLPPGGAWPALLLAVAGCLWLAVAALRVGFYPRATSSDRSKLAALL